MKLLDIEIRGFGCLKDYSLSLEDGVNVVSLPEGGKTTLISFVNAVFCGFSDGTKNYLPFREKSIPWHSDAFGGVIRFEHDNIVYKADAAWGENPENDVLYLSVNGSAPEAYATSSVLSEIIGIAPEYYTVLFTGAFSCDVQKSIGCASSAVCPEESDELSNSCLSPDSFNRALESVRFERKFIEGGENPGALSLLQNLLDVNRENLRQTEEAESRILEYSEKISYSEKLFDKYKSELTPDKAIEAVKTSSTITAKNDRVQSLIKRRSELNEVISETEQKEKKLKIPFVILTVLLLLADCLFAVLSVVNPGSPAFISEISSFLKGKMPYSLAAFGIVLILLTVILIAICTARSKKFKNYEEQLYRIYYSLCDTVNFGNFEPVDFDELGDDAESVLNEKIERLASDAQSADSFIEGTAKTFETIFKNEGEKARIRDEITSARSAMDVLSDQIASRTSYTDLLERENELEGYISSLNTRLETLNKSEEILLKASKRLKLSFLPELSKNAGSLLSDWTDGRYSAVTVSPSYGVCVYDGEFFRGLDCFGDSVKYLVSLALQASVISVLASDGREYPLFIDNPFKFISSETVTKITESLEIQTVITA